MSMQAAGRQRGIGGMKIAIVGSGGYIAGFLIYALEKETAVSRILKIDQSAEADVFLSLTEPERFDYKTLEGIDCIVFTAAVSGPDQCANEFEACWKINVTGTEYFIREALRKNCNVLFFSSDAVFGDIPGEIYTECSETRAETPYGRMKKRIEDSFKDNPRFKAIRLSYVVSAKDRFVSYCLSCIREGKTAEIFHPFYRNCITVSDVVSTVLWLIGHWQEYGQTFLNVTGRELVSRVRIADELNRLYENRLAYTIVEPDGSFYRNRPRITQMESLYLYRSGILKDSPFTEKLKKELEKIRI